MPGGEAGVGVREPVVVVYAFTSSYSFIFRLSVSHDGSSVPVEGVAGCEDMKEHKGAVRRQNEKSLLALPFH